MKKAIYTFIIFLNINFCLSQNLKQKAILLHGFQDNSIHTLTIPKPLSTNEYQDLIHTISGLNAEDQIPDEQSFSLALNENIIAYLLYCTGLINPIDSKINDFNF